MTEDLSQSDKLVYSFIRNRLVHGMTMPTLREINIITKKVSPRSAVLALERLEKAGLIRRFDGRVRLAHPSVNENASISTRTIPLIGTVAAGAPLLASQNTIAMIPVSTALARPGSNYFLLRVQGRSMDQARVGGGHIEDESIVLVRQQDMAEDGDIVVALVDDEATVKILERKNGIVILRPKSSQYGYTPIVLTDDCRIQGVVVAVLPSDLITTDNNNFMTKKNYHSVPKDNGWAVKKEGVKAPVSIHRTQAAAETKTQQLAKKSEAEAVYHRRDGTIKDKDSYGNDPHPPKDRVH